MFLMSYLQLHCVIWSECVIYTPDELCRWIASEEEWGFWGGGAAVLAESYLSYALIKQSDALQINTMAILHKMWCSAP
jgi:hypothetical protein